MAFKTSPALIAAMLALSAPAFAQDSGTTVPNTLPENLDAATKEAADSVAQAADGMAGMAADGMAGMAGGMAADGMAGGMAADSMAPAADAAPAADTPPAPIEAPGPTTAPAPDAPAGAAPAAPASAPAAAPAAPAGEPKVGDYYVKSTHTDWTLRCIKADKGVDPCELYQLMKDGDGNSVAEMTMIPLQGDVPAGATLVAPLETDLIAAITLKVDSGKARIYPFNFCTQIGCISRMGFTPDELAGLKRGNKASVTLLPFGGDPRNPVNLNLSLAGFTAAMDELTKLAEEARKDAPAADAPATDAPATEAPAADAPAAETPAADAPAAETPAADAPAATPAPAN